MSDPVILVVEDNPLTRKMLRLTLQTGGFVVVEAGDGREAIAAWQARRPDLVLQDLVLPDMSGFELVRRLRELPGALEVPILALSGFLGRIGDAQTADAGFTALLVKPIEPGRLIEVISTYFPALRNAVERVGAGRRLIVVDDDPVQLKLAKLCLSQFGFDVIAAGGARDALAAAEAHCPDAILSDVLMPETDGFELCVDVRRSPSLARVPVVLLSAWYQTESDRDLARQVGANALVTRTPDLEDAVRAIVDALHGQVPQIVESPSEQVRLQHARVVIQQLERQLAVSSGLARRCTLQAAQISLLGGISDALTHHVDTDVALHDVLAATLDAAGISKGALYLRLPGGALTLRDAIGFSAPERSLLAGFFGHLSLLESMIEDHATVSIPSPGIAAEIGDAILRGSDVAAAHVVPLAAREELVGAMFLGAKRTDVTSDDAIAFARAMAGQLGQALDLAASFARLAASEQRYRTLVESANDAISIVTTDGTIREVNRRWETLFARSAAQAVGHNIREFVPAGRGRMAADGFATTVKVGGGTSEPVEIMRGDGSVVLVRFSTTVVQVNGDRYVLSIGHDVTDEVRANAQLMVADRMASVGTLAAGVAHEINNPLAALMLNVELASRSVVGRIKSHGSTPDLEELHGELVDAVEAGERVRNIVRDIKMFSRAEDDQRGPVDVHKVIESSVRMAWNEIRHRARLVKDYGDVPPVVANESRLGQVVLNLVVNAAQAIVEGNAERNEIRIRSHSDRDRARVVIEIADTGPGIPPENLRNLFTPFFTTKPKGVGTGLGLAICHRIITGLGGEISVSSELGRGTIFRVTIPAGAIASEPAVTPRVEELAVRRGRILVVDDERMVGVAIHRLFEREHDVEILTSGAAALALIDGGARFDIILCDLMMPDMTGSELHAALAARAPDQAERMIFVTGGAFTPRARAFLAEVRNATLEKPFDIDALRSLVNEKLR